MSRRDEKEQPTSKRKSAGVLNTSQTPVQQPKAQSLELIKVYMRRNFFLPRLFLLYV